jgi:hypothetical protein
LKDISNHSSHLGLQSILDAGSLRIVVEELPKQEAYDPRGASSGRKLVQDILDAMAAYKIYRRPNPMAPIQAA